MQNTTNFNLKKPDYTDFADIKDINDNMDILDGALHDTQNSVATFTSSDVADGSATSWASVTKVDSGETHKSIFAKMSQMFKNIRYLYKMLGTTDISSIGNGTVTGGLTSLNDSLPLCMAGRDWGSDDNLKQIGFTPYPLKGDFTFSSGTRVIVNKSGILYYWKGTLVWTIRP